MFLKSIDKQFFPNIKLLKILNGNTENITDISKENMVNQIKTHNSKIIRLAALIPDHVCNKKK